ncbi:hypothetical protein [Acinetobacter gerneri]|uniref:hypothetical protein n=1 Tax=Acinetobacter gerneri TaxID=202952 RepID=UPI003214EB15
MNMTTNISKHPCANKCPNFKGEQCNTCLVQEVEVADSDFLIDDVVVKIHGDDDTLYVFAMQSEINPDYGYIGEPDAEQGECIALDDIRHATVAEIQANRRLTEAEQALAEVS